MQIKSVRELISKIVLGIIILFSFNFLLNITLYNPTFITPIYDFVMQHKLIPLEQSGYPLVSISSLNQGLYTGARATVIGVIEEVIKSPDGDWHINVRNKDDVMVAEIIPEYPLPPPQVGDKVRIWGVTRYDIAHRWWEIHPVINWKKVIQ